MRERKIAPIESYNPEWNDLVPRVLTLPRLERPGDVILSEAKDLSLQSDDGLDE